jgi:tetratricopeptide (TPR) repeat protein
MYVLSQRLIGQLYFLQGKNYLREEYYGVAISRLTKSVQYNENDYITWNYLGRAYNRLGLLQTGQEAFNTAEQAKQAYLKAAELNRHDAEAAFGLAREEARLERLYAELHPEKKDNPYEPLPYFRDAIRLRSNGISYHYALARYLHRKGNKQELLSIVTNLARIYPPVYNHLPKEPFWNPEVKQAVKKGLLQAIDEGILAHNAHMGLSSLLRDEKDLAGAILHYKQAIDHKDMKAHSGNYVHLGRLYVEDKQFADAEATFLKALAMSQNREGDLNAIFRAYTSTKHYKELLTFYQQATDTFQLPARTDILFARTLMDTEEYDRAKDVLNELNQKDPNAEAYYWLFRIAQKQKDLDAMELSIQKAAFLDPKNSQYHLQFSQVLNRMNKVGRAEKEAGLAIEHAPKPSAGLFNYRASIRWKKEDHRGAADDWKSALVLQPTNASFHAKLAEAYIMLGDLPKATSHYEKATQIDANNQTYKQKLELLK